MIEINPFGPQISQMDHDLCTRDRWRKTFLGITQAHTYWLYQVIDDILNENQQIQGIIEIGTYRGALSVFLGLECYERGLKPLLTFDTRKFFSRRTMRYLPRLFELLKIDFVLRDCFSKKSIKQIKDYLDTPVFFVCDGGNKTREFNKFAPLLPKGSIIAAHDWPRGIWYDRIKDTTDKFGFFPIKIEDWCAPPDYIFMSFWKRWG